MKRFVVLAVVALVIALGTAVRAADPSGRWSATFMSQVGEQAYTYDFVVKGTTLTGTAKGSLTGETKITDGKVDGDTFTFTENATYEGMMITFTYKCKMTSADTIELSREIMGIAETATAKRAK
ncbi:MAG TPA: hypothetical protein VM846_09325 [Vicinamibacterales bacterium]|jgi:hypothetical protein|nr:hypothetical protein [Vicinamibacterales bacterium]